MQDVHILRVTNESDFGRIIHESAHSTEAKAWAYWEANKADIETDVDLEWRRAIDVHVVSMDYMG